MWQESASREARHDEPAYGSCEPSGIYEAAQLLLACTDVYLRVFGEYGDLPSAYRVEAVPTFAPSSAGTRSRRSPSAPGSTARS